MSSHILFITLRLTFIIWLSIKIALQKTVNNKNRKIKFHKNHDHTPLILPCNIFFLTDEVDLKHSKIDTGGNDINIDIDAVEGLLSQIFHN